MNENTLTNTTDVVNAVKYAVRTRAAWARFVETNNITRDDIADAARQIAALAFPGDDPVQKVDGVRTRYGNAVQAAGYMMRAVLATDSEDSTTPDVALITRAGAKATLAEVTAAWRAVQS